MHHLRGRIRRHVGGIGVALLCFRLFDHVVLDDFHEFRILFPRAFIALFEPDPTRTPAAFVEYVVGQFVIDHYGIERAEFPRQIVRFGDRAPFQTVLETVLFFNADIRFRDIVQQHG